ncbi:MAG: hypothetical protein LBK08_13405 [Treponema sp.]|jgi:hypothetical protein|nr:hypothetical protein [Treponema sp.]
MKKVLFCLLLLAVFSGVYAQELKFDGYLNSGAGLVFTDRQISDPYSTTPNARKARPYFTAFGVDSEQWGYRFRLNGSYTNKDANAGVKFRLQAQSQNGATAVNRAITLPTAQGWVSFLDSVITVNGGIINDGTWETGDVYLNDDMGEGLGLLAKITPVKGFDFGLGAYAISSLGGGDNNALARSIVSNFAEFDDVKYTVNLAYTMPDVFRAKISWRNKNRSGADGSGNTTRTAPGRDESSRLFLSAGVLAVKGLTAVVAADFDNIQSFSTVKTGDVNAWGGTVAAGGRINNSGKLNFHEALGYKVSDLSAGFNVSQFISFAERDVTNSITGITTQEKVDVSLFFNPWVSYSLGNLVPRLDVVYMMGGQINGSSATAEGKYYRRGYDPNYTRETWVLGIRPSIKFSLGSCFLELGDLVSVEGQENKFYGVNVVSPSSLPGSDTRKDSRVTNTLYADLKWSF